MAGSEPSSDGLEEARRAQAEQEWEKGYQTLYSAREALLDSLYWAQRILREEVGPGVVSEAHIKASFQPLSQSLLQAGREVGQAFESFQSYFRLYGQGDTLRPEVGESAGEASEGLGDGDSLFKAQSEPDPDSPIEYWPTAPAAAIQAGEAATVNGVREAD